MLKNVKKFVFFVVIVALLGVFALLGCVAYVDINASEAKEYLMEKYDFKNSELMATKYTEYVYEDIADCSSLWLKKCTKNENLAFKYTFKTNNGKKIIVKEDKDGNFEDNYKTKSDVENMDSNVEISDEDLIDELLK